MDFHSTKPIYLQIADFICEEILAKKWGIGENEFEEIMGRKPVPHEFYGEEKGLGSVNKLKEKLKLIYKYNFSANQMNNMDSFV